MNAPAFPNKLTVWTFLCRVSNIRGYRAGCVLSAGFTILIADDHDALRETLKALEARNGWCVSGLARDGREAVQKTIELKPDAVILDFAMPVMNGVTAAREILMVSPNLPVLLYTSHFSATLELEAKKAGIRRVLAKNEPIEQLLNAVEALVQEKLRLVAENILASPSAKTRSQTGAT